MWLFTNFSSWGQTKSTNLISRDQEFLAPNGLQIRIQLIKIQGSCPDSVAAVKKSSFFKLKKEREKREKKEVYHAIICPKSQILLCKTGPGLPNELWLNCFQLDSMFADCPTSWVQIGNKLLMESGQIQDVQHAANNACHSSQCTMMHLKDLDLYRDIRELTWKWNR